LGGVEKSKGKKKKKCLGKELRTVEKKEKTGGKSTPKNGTKEGKGGARKR